MNTILFTLLIQYFFDLHATSEADKDLIFSNDLDRVNDLPNHAFIPFGYFRATSVKDMDSIGYFSVCCGIVLLLRKQGASFFFESGCFVIDFLECISVFHVSAFLSP